jgi:hypothetical protein
VYVTLLVTLALSTARDTWLLFSSPVAVGADGYYYVLQINELLNHGHSYFPTNTPLVFYALATLSIVTRNAILAIKLGSIGFNVFLFLGVFALVSSITRNRWLGVLGAAIATLSGMHFFMIAEFVKNLAGVVLLIWGAWCALRASETHQRRWCILSVVLLIAAFLSHISTWGIAPSLAMLILLGRGLMTRGGSKFLRLGWLVAGVLLMILPALIAAQNFVELPAWLGNELLIRPRLPISLRSPVGKAEMVALLLAAPTTLFLMARHRSALPRNPLSLVVCAVALWSLLITLNPFLNHDVRQLGIIGRLDHLMYLQVAIILPALVLLSLHINRKFAAATLALTFVFILASMISALPNGLRPQYLLERQQMIQALPEQREQLSTNPLVIAQHGDEFVITWVLGIPAQQNFPTTSQGQSIYWLLHQVNPTTLTPSAIVVMEEDNGSGLILMKHGDLTQWIDTINEEERNRLLAQNPHLKKYVEESQKVVTLATVRKVNSKAARLMRGSPLPFLAPSSIALAKVGG